MVFLLYLLAFTPVVFTNLLVYSYVSDKVIWVRSIVALVSIWFFIKLVIDRLFRDKVTAKIRALIKNPIFISVCAYFFFIVLSTFLAVDKFSAFYGTIERGEGMIGLLFFFGFFIFISILFSEKDWIWFFRFSLFSTVIIFVYQLFQLVRGYTPYSSAGNLGYLAGYFLFSILSVAIVYLTDQSKNNLWRIISIIIFFMSIAGILITGKRGVLVGLIVGTVISLFHSTFFNHWSRKLLITLLIILVAGGGSFFATRDHVFWQKIPILNSFVTTSPYSTVTARLYTYKAAIFSVNPEINGYKKLFFGWGPENYLIASNEYPGIEGSSTDLYLLSMYDRAHNQILDVLTTSGLLGALSYLAIWFFIFRFTLLKNLGRAIGREELFLGSALILFGVSYFVQNLFIFETYMTYISFFAFVGFIIYLEMENNERPNAKSR